MPEFLAEGQAIQDLVKPMRVVIGTKSDSAFELLCRLTQSSEEDDESKVIRTSDTASSELGKLMCNAMLA